MTAPSFPEMHCEVVRDAVIARSDDPAEPDQVLGCTVVATSMIRGQKARAIVSVDRPLELELRNDEAIINIARPGLFEAMKELADSNT